MERAEESGLSLENKIGKICSFTVFNEMHYTCGKYLCSLMSVSKVVILKK
jgi:hypothetical protein